MINILQAIFQQLIDAGNDIKAVYGERWLHAFEGINDKVTFYMQPQSFRFNIQNNEYTQRLTWVIAYEAQQAEIDQNKTIVTEEEIWAVNLKFISALINYTDINGFKPFTDFGEIQANAFHDITLFNYPASGFICEVEFKQLSTIFC